MYQKYTRLFGVMFIIAAMTVTSCLAGIPVLNLRSTSNFVILAGSTVTGIPPVTITGDIGLSPAAGSYVTGFDGSNVVGTLYVADASGPSGSVQNATLLTTAKGDLTTAYNDAANRTPVPTGTFLNPGAGNIGGMNLAAGLYKFTGAAGITGADVTLTGNATDVWIFQIGSSLDLGSGIKIILAGGALAANIFWQVGTSATLGTYSVFKGTILADQSISLGTGASMEGRALAFSAAVTMSSGVTSTKAVFPELPIFSSNKYQIAFDSVKNGFTKLDSITVTNTGSSDLVIGTITSSNTVFTVSPSSGTITPNGTLKFYITFAPSVDGAKSGKIIFFHNAAKPKDTIDVTGTGISPKFVVNPASVAFGNVRNLTTKQDSVTVTNTGIANLVITTVSSTNTLFVVTPTSGTISPNGTMKFYITFNPLTDGAKSGAIIFNHNAAKPKDTVQVTGTGVSPKFTVNPATTLPFGNVRNGTNKRDSVTVTNTGTSDLVLSSVTSSNSRFTVTPTTGTIIPGGTMKVYVTFAPLVDGAQTGVLVFNHNALVPKDSITLTGTGVSPKFTVNPTTTLPFGNVRNGTNKRDSVTVTNTGTSDLVLSSVTSSNSRFTVTPTTGTIIPGGTMKVYVTFAPLVDGAQTGVLIFNHNALVAKDSITLTGTGVSPKFTFSGANGGSIAFGNVTTFIKKTDSVTITNTGTYILTISGITSSNSVFTATPTTSTVAPGASLKIYVSFTPIADGFQTGKIILSHDAGTFKDTITVSGTGVSSKFFSIPANSLAFGNVRINTTKTDSVLINNTGTGDLIISSISSSNSVFSANVTSATIVPGASMKFYIKFAPLVNGFQSGYVFFYNNTSHKVDSIGVGGTGTTPPVFTINKKAIDFGLVRINTGKMDSVSVLNTGIENLSISSITSSNPLFTVTPISGIIPGGSVAWFYVTFSPKSEGLQNGYIYFNHNATNLKDSVYVSGTGVSPIPSVNLKSINFGNVKIGTIKTDSVVISNSGTTSIIISGVSSTNMYFSTTPTTSIIPPGASRTFNVSFAPQVLGFQTGYVYYNHNGTSSKDSVLVTGTGVASDNIPKFSVNSSNVDFGNVTVNSSKSKSIIITNAGTTNLVLTNILSGDSHYKITPLTATIKSAESLEFVITFAPTAVGQLNSQINFTDNEGIKNVVSVTGNGIDSLKVITIKEARDLPTGTEFIVEGIVTRTMGSYTRIQDATGGLTIYQQTGEFFDEVNNFSIQMSDKIRVQGKISEVNFLKVIVGNDLTAHSRLSRLNTQPMPVTLTLTDLATSGERYESMLITVKNMTVTSAGDINFKEAKTYLTKDADESNIVSIRIGNSDDTFMDGLPISNSSATFVGVLSQSSISSPLTDYQLLPVLASDLVFSPLSVFGQGSDNQNSLSNKPNPFSASTEIQYTLDKSDIVTLKVYNVLGQEVATLVNGFQASGSYSIPFNPSELSESFGTSIYIYRLQVASTVLTKQMVFVK